MAKNKHESPHILSYIMEIDKAIRNGEFPNASSMNKKMGWTISRSTFLRYMDILRDTYKAPVEFDFKRNGYFYTDKTYFMPHVMLTEGELLTLSTILPLLDQYKNTPLEGAYRGLMQKMIEMLPDSISVDSSLINNEVHFISNPITRLEEGVFENVLRATKLHRTLTFEYKTATAIDYEKREFDPYHVICQKESWYLLGFSHSSEAIRIYAMPRIRKCRITEKQFSIPKDFKIENHIDPEMGVWNSSAGTFTVEIEFESRIKTFVSERHWHTGQVLRENANGSVYLSFKTNQLEQTAAWILSFAGMAKVLNPPELKKEVAKAARKILKGY
ncbi:MAG: WYL domain-containing protein [Treponema sp.]|nr:WYL domain-containing protein [Treponema sp.]MBO6219415.1 WYL domain-containing protein [Treponema sp.]